MLRVKKSVDLKELEKFRFHKEFDYYEGGEEKLFDLIQADLVEKVEE